MTEPSAERRPIGWWLKTADARIEQAFEDAFDSQSITRREWQVLESVAGAPVLESELLLTLEAFPGARDAVDDLRRRGLITDVRDEVLTLTDAAKVRTSGRLPVSQLFAVLSPRPCPQRTTPTCSGC